jgi:SagB-type dehydrogenase family enzyme
MSGIAGSYHETTSYQRSQMGGHFLDWQNQPEVFKTYDGLDTIPMPRQVPLPRENLFSLHGGSRNAFQSRAAFNLEKLSEILLLTYTLTAQSRVSGGEFYFRSAASAGALYPTEIYVLANGLKDLDDGLYHFSIAAHGLVKLRGGRFSQVVKGSVNEGDFHETPLTFFLTAIFFRSAWKYRERSYRYHLLDTGHVLENLDLSLKSLGLASEITFDFEDRSVNDLLGLDENREAALALCRVKGHVKSPSGGTVGTQALEPLPEAVKGASRVSRREFDVPEVHRIHRAGYDIKPGEADVDMCRALGVEAEVRIPMPAVEPPDTGFDYPEAVFRRRSGRNFVAETLPMSHLRALLKMLSETGGTGRSRSLDTICTGFLTSGCGNSQGWVLSDGCRRGGPKPGKARHLYERHESYLPGSGVDGQCLPSFPVHDPHERSGTVVGAERVSICHDDRRPHGRAALPGRFGLGFGLLRYRRLLRR